MFERFTERARQVVVLAQEEARTLKHNYIGTEHILLGLVRENEGVAARILLDFDADSEKIRNEVIRMLSGPGGRRQGSGGGGGGAGAQGEGTKNNPVLIGEPGVGKTAVVEGLATRITQDDVPELLKGKQIYPLDLAALV